MSGPENLRPTRNEETLRAMKAMKHISFHHPEADPGETLYVSVKKLKENEVIMPGASLSIHIDFQDLFL